MEFINDKLFFVIIVLVILLLIYVINSFMNLKMIFKKYFKLFFKYIFLVFLLPAIFFLISDYYFDEFHKIKNYDLIKELCKILFSAGVFTAALNFLDSLNVFKKNFKNIIMSKEFDGLLTSKLDALAYSQEHLSRQGNLDEIWQTVTLCKYQKEFPELYDKLKNKIENDLFKKSNISYYYKNFQINYYIELIDENIIRIREKSSFTIIRPSKDEFEFDFKSSYNIEDENSKVEAKFSVKNTNDLDFNTIEPLKSIEKNIETITISKILKGHLEYHIESEIIMLQNINNDRNFTFGSARIIDDLTIYIKNCDKLNVVFKPLNNNKLYHNGTHFEEEKSYINRDVLLSGEKFILFFYRNN